MEFETTLQRLTPRWFVSRNAHVASPPILMQLLRSDDTRGDSAGEGRGGR